MRNRAKFDRTDEIKEHRDALILKLYKMKYTITEIGLVFKMTGSRVYQIIKANSQ